MESSIDEWMGVYDKEKVKRENEKYTVYIHNGDNYHNWEIKEESVKKQKNDKKIYLLVHETNDDPDWSPAGSKTEVFSTLKEAREYMESSIDDCAAGYGKDKVKREDGLMSFYLDAKKGKYFHNWEIREEKI